MCFFLAHRSSKKTFLSAVCSVYKEGNKMQQAVTVSTNEKRANLGWTSGKPTGNLYLRLGCRTFQSAFFFPKQTQSAAQWNCDHWDVVERGPIVWTKLRLGQTNSCLAVGCARTHPFPPHTPSHPTPQWHFTSDLIHLHHPPFMLTLTSFSLCHQSFPGGAQQTQKHSSFCQFFCFYLLNVTL